MLLGLVAPEFLADPFVHPFGERLSQPVGHRLQQDRAVVVEGRLELRDLLLTAQARRDGEGADIVPVPRFPGGDEVAQRPIRDAVAVLPLLTQVVQRRQHVSAGLVGVHLDVVTDRVRGEEADHPVGGQPLLLDQRVEHLLGVVVELARRLTGGRVVEDVGETALHLPGVEERLPVDVLAQLGQVVLVKLPHTETLGGHRWGVVVPLDRGPVRTGLLQRQHRPLVLLGMPFAQRGVVLLGRLQQRGPLLVVEQRGSHRHRTRSVLDPHHRTGPARRNLHRRVRA